MNKQSWIVVSLIAAVSAGAQQALDAGKCDCPSCRDESSSSLTRPWLPDLNQPEPDPAGAGGHEKATGDGADGPAHGEHASRIHAHAGEGSCGEHAEAGHPRGETGTGSAKPHGPEMQGCVAGGHEGHDHGAHDDVDGIRPTEDMQIKAAGGGRIERMASFPAEVQVNRSRAAAVSALYAGRVTKVHADIGDAVEAGAPLADVEARDAFSVYTVRSPLSGTVVARGRSAGETAGEQDVLFEVADLSSVWVEVSLYPRYRAAVRPGQAVFLSGMGGERAETAIDTISPLVDPQTRTIKARCVMERGGTAFAPGSFVRAQIAVEAVEATVRVEADAVQRINGETVVFIQDEHGIEPRDVTTGLSDGTFTEITSGLNPGEHYVARGAFKLKAGLIVSGLDPHAGHGH